MSVAWASGSCLCLPELHPPRCGHTFLGSATGPSQAWWPRRRETE